MSLGSNIGGPWQTYDRSEEMAKPFFAMANFFTALLIYSITHTHFGTGTDPIL